MRLPRSVATTPLIAFALSATLALLSALLVAAPAEAKQPRRIGQVVSEDCYNLALFVSLDDEQVERAAAMLPREFTLTSEPTLLVESSTCARATVNGRAIGRFHLSEAALSIEQPRELSSAQMSETAPESIFMLSQLDTNKRLSRFKKRAGYRSEVTRIEIDLGNPLLPRTATASAGGRIAPSSVSVTLSPQLTPTGLTAPNPGIVYKLWTVDRRGRVVGTTNSNRELGNAAVGYGTVTVEKGTTLHRLLGSTTASGYSISGSAAGFTNDTYRFRD
ncbi:hypothetical protein [uncultured Nocardioides sp.]|uniref:hypothetical protein n=1 Tax=uncultured Nocardioides sp. TaxID=198441 RepID=UPI00260628F6|nr:hypothetical protein [uncultured Nocardioides sp.]MCK5930223.1 hypothetical protein [Nocardioides sp.]